LYVFHVESAIETFTNESISVVKVSRDGLVFRCLVGLPLDKGSGNAANHNEIKNQQFYLKLEMRILKDIIFLELFPVVVALCIWGEQLKNKKIIFNIDNQSVVHIINKKSSKSVRVMSLVRHLVLSTLQYNIMIKALHISLSCKLYNLRND
jgi:hypothetical protein